MFVSERLVYLELQKTGCTHIGTLLANCIAGKQIGKHNRLPADLAASGRYVVGSIRDPWDWYVSLWASGCRHYGGFWERVTQRSFRRPLVRRRHLWRDLVDIRRETSKPVGAWKRTYADPRDQKLFREWLGLAFSPKRRYDFGEKYGSSAIASFAGLLTFRYTNLYSKDVSHLFSRNCTNDIEELVEFDKENNILDFVIRNESLERDLIEALRCAGYGLTDEQVDGIHAAEKTNISSREDVGYYYDEETVEMVMRMERFIIEKYGYVPPQPR